MIHKLLIGIAFGLLGVSWGGVAGAFELTPLPTGSEVAAAKKRNIIFRTQYPAVEFALHRFSVPVHEALTQLAHDCGPSLDECINLALDNAMSSVLVGVRWNDDPPFKFAQGHGRYRGCENAVKSDSTVSFALNPKCWLMHFKKVSEEAAIDPEVFAFGKGTPLARSHFGDLQFLHSMATRKDEPAEVTKAKVLMWLGFTWRMQSRNDDRLRPTTKTSQVPIAGFSDHFPKTEDRDIEMLFTVGRPWARHWIHDVAFGSFLHVVQDSFSGGHTQRDGALVSGCSVVPIATFHTYAGQDSLEHKSRDTLGAARQKASLLEVMRELTERRYQEQSWAQIKPYLDECVFRLAPGAGVASSRVSE